MWEVHTQAGRQASRQARATATLMVTHRVAHDPCAAVAAACQREDVNVRAQELVSEWWCQPKQGDWAEEQVNKS